MENASDTALKGLRWILGSVGVKVLLGLLSTMILARLLTPEEFGLMAVATVVFILLDRIFTLGIDTAIIQAKELNPDIIRSSVTFLMIIGIVAGTITYLTAGWFENLLQTEGVGKLIKGFSGLLFIRCSCITSEGLVLRNHKFKEVGILRMVLKIIGYLIVAVILAYLNFGVWALFWAYAIFRVGQGISYYILQPVKPLLVPRVRSFKKLLRFGIGQTLNRFAHHIAARGDYLIIGRWMGPVILGFYERAYDLMQKPSSMLGEGIQNVIFPVFSRLQTAPKKLSRGLIRSSVLVTFLGLPISLFVLVNAHEIVLIILGEQWTRVIPLLRIFALGTAVRMAGEVYVKLIKSLGYAYLAATIKTFYALFLLGGVFFIVIMNNDIEIVATFVLIALIMNFLLLMFYSLKVSHTSGRKFLKAHLHPLILGLLVLLVSGLTSIGLKMFLEMHFVFNFLINIIVVAGVVILLSYKIPSVVLGTHGKWLILKLFKINLD